MRRMGAKGTIELGSEKEKRRERMMKTIEEETFSL